MEFIKPRFTGSVGLSGSLEVTGTVNVLNGITGSLFGTASYALNAEDVFPYSGSATITGTLYVTDEISLGEISGSTPFTASQVISASATDTRLSGSFSGSFEGFGGNLTGLTSTLGLSASLGTGSVAMLTESLSLTGSQFGIVPSIGETGSVVTFKLDDNVQISQSLYVTDNLYVSGTSLFSGSITASVIHMYQSASVSGTNVFGTSSWAQTASYLDGFVGQGITLPFLTASTTWSINHGLNTLYPLVNVWQSGSEEVIQPDVVESKNLNTVEVRFTVPVTGYANVAIAGAPLYQASPFFTASFALTASFFSGSINVANAVSASYAATASYVLGAGNSISASWASSSISASIADTASYVSANNIDGTVGTASIAYTVATISGSAPSGSAVQVGSLWYDENSLSLYVRYEDPSGSQWWVPAFNGVLANAVSSSYSYTSQISNGFTSSFLSQSTVIVNHNLNTRGLAVTVYDDLHYQVIPSSVQLSDNNNAVIQFFSVESGYVVVK
jgi:hypothetical protein